MTGGSQPLPVVMVAPIEGEEFPMIRHFFPFFTKLLVLHFFGFYFSLEGEQFHVLSGISRGSTLTTAHCGQFSFNILNIICSTVYSSVFLSGILQLHLPVLNDKLQVTN